MNPARLFAAVAGMPLPAAAARIAAAGVPVFPCVPGGKRPLVEHGFHEATTDAGQVAGWWRRWPASNIGVPTGAASGLDVVDVDVKAAGSGFAAFDRARQAGLVTGWVALVHTPSGGMHAYFPADPERQQSSWQAAGARVDFRGTGGYIIVPPSIIEVQGGLPGRYELIGGSQPAPGPVDAVALREFLDPRPASSFRAGGVSREQDARRLAGWVAALGEGERNRGLFWAACRLAEAGAPPNAALDVLGPAAQHAGLPPREVFTTIRSAYRAVGAGAAPTSTDSRSHDDTGHRAVASRTRVLS
ncbi:bifunctional DNA primase/polymerase [Herbiconiux moechotypicola]|uniref:Bifunctional DNA primase/polymerase n=1 Tax=Herbiconiux moechotypicola TaxID=637393 RepID=A0ABP5QAF1_9MICO|nr:bifunctional DNA primase/polymerase [Herbiconiux moechotypicola]MCS5729425.1 bifunctional DNA primase/polymerase [Herbiconiux moechotypicola]